MLFRSWGQALRRSDGKCGVPGDLRHSRSPSEVGDELHGNDGNRTRDGEQLPIGISSFRSFVIPAQAGIHVASGLPSIRSMVIPAQSLPPAKAGAGIHSPGRNIRQLFLHA